MSYLASAATLRTLTAAAIVAVALSSVPLLAQCEIARLEDVTGAADYFGIVDIEGRNVVVGAPWTGISGGAAYIYRIDQAPSAEGGGVVWTQDAKLESEDREQGDNFGAKVAISGSKVVIAAQGDDDNGSQSGSAYVFSRGGGVWLQDAKLTPSPSGMDALFGRDVDIDGDWIVVGASGYQDFRGAAFAFRFDGVNWIQEPELIPSDLSDVHIFGSAVTIKGDRLAVGATGDDTHGTNTGAVYVFHWNGDEWVEEAKLTAPGSALADNLGFSLDFGDDDTWLVAGTEGAEAAYVFRRKDSGWIPVPVAKLEASDGGFGDDFGRSVATSGRNVLVGAPYASSQGVAYVFTRSGDTWAQTARITASDGGVADEFGESVALSGRLGVVGSPIHPFAEGPGHAYVLGMDGDLCDVPVGSPR